MRGILITVLLSIAIPFGIAIGLIVSERPRPLTPGPGLDFTRTLEGGGGTPAPLEAVEMRDGFDLQVRRYPGPGESAPLLILVHGSGWHGLQFDRLAKRLSSTADVIVPDLRGHGPSPGTRGDIPKIDQFEEDLADLIEAEARAGQKVVLAGHSSGGGLVVRMAGGAHGALLDSAVLLAPFLQHDAPTTRPNSGGWAQPLTRRIIGLAMLNTFRVRVLNHLTTIQLRMPDVVMNGPLGDTATTQYSYRLMTGFAPRRRYLQDIAALPPFLLIAGTADEAFVADGYEPLMSKVTDKGRYELVAGAGHLDIVDHPQTADLLERFLDEL